MSADPNRPRLIECAQGRLFPGANFNARRIWRTLIAFLIAGAGVAGLAYLLSTLLGLNLAWLSNQSTLVGLALLMLSDWSLRRKANRSNVANFRRILSRDPAESLQSKLTAIIEQFHRESTAEDIRLLGLELARGGHFGAVRVRWSFEQPLDPPLQVGFEPIGLLDCLSVEILEDSAAAARRAKQRESLEAQRRVIRWVTLGSLALMALILGSMFFRNRSLQAFASMWPLLLLPLLVLIPRTRWLAVPGGVAVLRARVWETRWTPRVFSAADATLVSMLTRDGIAVIAVANADCALAAEAPVGCVDFAIRAFLSDHPPPDAEWLSNPT